MSYANTWSHEVTAYEASVADRMGFIRRTYAHLLGAIIAFVVLEAALLQTELPNILIGWIGNAPFGWLLFLGAFMLVSWVANSWANSGTSAAVQYAGLGLYVAAEAVLFCPLLLFAAGMDSDIPITAGLTTLGVFGAITVFLFVTRADFSFLGSILWLGGFAALGLIAAAVIFQFALGPIFSVAMVALACGYILYYTSNVLHHYNTRQHVAASLALFASVALLFWYLLQLYMSMDD